MEETKINAKDSQIHQTNLVSGNGESDSDLDETVVDDYGEDFDESMEYGQRGTKFIEDTESFLRLKSQMNLLDEDEHEDQETLDEKAEDRSFTFQESSNDSTSSSGSMKGIQVCQICNKKSRNISFLWQHYCKTHS